MPLELTPASLHHAILRHVVDTGRAPRVAELAERSGRGEGEVREALRALAAEHGVVLHPHDDEVWIVHPFSLAPTTFLLRKDGAEWWGTCAWCAFGAAALLGGEVAITTTVGANGRQVALRVRDGELLDRGFWVHFPVPMTAVWDNVVYTCSTMLVFEDAAAVDAWCRRHGIPRGDLQPAERVAAFAAEWYGRHLDPDWRKWSVDEAREIFRRHGLTHPVWALPASGERF